MRRILTILSVLVLAVIVFAGQWLETTFENSTLTNTILVANSIHLSSKAGEIYAGDGTDGGLTVPSSGYVINTYTKITEDTLVGATKIYAFDSSGFSAGDEVLVIQMQGDSSVVGGLIVGQYETRWIDHITGNDIFVKTAVANTYYSGIFNANPSEACQIVRIPQYTDVTVPSGKSITCNSWNGETGGIVVFRATGTVHVQSGGEITAYHKGFREGTANKSCGEGDIGRGNIVKTTRNGSGGGGGGGGPWDNWGAGGGHATYGGDNHGSQGGWSCGVANLSKMIMGGGGGDGSTHNGGTGGGIVYIEAYQIKVEGGVRSNGEGETNGGGAGGSIYLIASGVDLGTNLVTASGGSGGGIGSVGRIAVKGAVINGSTSPSYNLQQTKFAGSGNCLIPTHDCTFTREWGTFDWNWNSTQTLTFKVESKALDSGWDLDSASQVTKGQDISALASVTDGHRYIRWKAFLSSSSDTESPELEDVTINFSAEPDKIEWIYVK